MRTQYGEKKAIKEGIAKILEGKGYETQLAGIINGKVNYIVRFQRLFRGFPKPVSFYKALFIRDDSNIIFDIVKVNSINLDGKYYYCGFRELKEHDAHGYVTDEIIKDHGWVKNNKGILYLNLKAFIIIYNIIAMHKKRKSDLLKRLLLDVIDK